MAQQINLDLLWAEAGGKTDTGDVKYESGWIDEIPTYQNFNFMLNALDNNILYLAENGAFDWQTEIAYKVGAAVREGGYEWYCITAHSGQQPSLDATNSYWVNGKILGRNPVTPLTQKHGLYVADINERTLAAWDGNDVTIENANALVALNTTSGSTGNLVFGNVRGELVVVDVGNSVVPDGRSVEFIDPAVHKIFHEGNPPTQSVVAGTIPDAPANGTLYARKDGNWVKASSTDVQTQPPPPNQGAGGGWYNLDDGQLYLDIDDGDSSQWVPANPPVVPAPPPVSITEVTRTGTGLASYDLGITLVNEEAITIVVDGTPQAASTYTAVGTVVSFISDFPEVGAEITFRVIESIAVNTPATNTVTRAAIQDTVWNQLSNSRKNLLINGGFDVWQRGQAFSSLADRDYTADRWSVNSDRASLSASVQAGQTAGFNSLLLAGGAGTFLEAVQRVEGRYLSGRTVTISALVTATAGDQLTFRFADGDSGTNFLIQTPAITATGSPQKITATVTLGSISDAFLFVGIRTTGDTLEVTEAQLEEGPEATPFEHRPIGEELALCKRYYQTYTGSDLKGFLSNTTNTVRTIGVSFSPELRGLPAISNISSNTGTPAVSTYSPTGLRVDITVAGGTNTALLTSWTADAEL